MTAMWDYLSPVVSASLLLTAFAFLIIMLSTRLITGKYYSLACASTSVPYEPPTIPYWIPYYAHLINLWSADLQVWLEQWRCVPHRDLSDAPITNRPQSGYSKTDSCHSDLRNEHQNDHRPHDASRYLRKPCFPAKL